MLNLVQRCWLWQRRCCIQFYWPLNWLTKRPCASKKVTPAISSLFVVRIIDGCTSNELAQSAQPFVLHQTRDDAVWSLDCRKCLLFSCNHQCYLSIHIDTVVYFFFCFAVAQLISVIIVSNADAVKCCSKAKAKAELPTGHLLNWRRTCRWWPLLTNKWAAELAAVDWRQESNRAFNQQEQLDAAKQHYSTMRDEVSLVYARRGEFILCEKRWVYSMQDEASLDYARRGEF